MTDMSHQMLNPNGGGSTPVPDPTKLTTEAVDRASTQFEARLSSMREIIETRLDAADTAVVLRLAATDRNAEAQREYLLGKIDNVRDVTNEKFAAVDMRDAQSVERVKLAADESRIGLKAALDAAKEAVAEQNKAATAAINKSEGATAKTIETNAELFQASLAGIAGIVGDLKDRIITMESVKQGIGEQRTQQHAGQGAGMAVVMSVISGISVVVAVVALILSLRPH